MTIAYALMTERMSIISSFHLSWLAPVGLAMSPRAVLLQAGSEEVFAEDIVISWGLLVMVLSLSDVYEVVATVMRFRVVEALLEVVREIVEKMVRF